MSRRSPETSSVHGAAADQGRGCARAASWISAGLDAPRQQVVAVDDDVEGAGVDRVDDRQAGGALVEDRLGVALRRVDDQRVAVDVFDGEALRPDRAEGRVRIRSRARAQSCSGESAAGVARLGRAARGR